MDINKIQILSESDWYFINSENEVELYERENRNDMEIVRIFNGETFMDMPLEHPITYMPIVGGFLFDSEEVAEKYKSSLESSSGFSTLIDNSLSGSKRNDMACVYKEVVPVENGIYCVPEFDELLSDDCWLMHVHGLTKKNEVVEPKIVGENEHFYISKYINMLGVFGGIIPIDEENGYLIQSKYDLTMYRCLFELFSECGNVYVSLVMVPFTNEPKDTFYITRLNDIRLYGSKHSAMWAKTNCISAAEEGIEKIQNEAYYNAWLAKKERFKNVLHLVVENSDMIVSNAKKVVPTPKEKHKVLRFIYENIDGAISVLKYVVPLILKAA